MQYMLLIYSDDAELGASTDDELRALYAGVRPRWATTSRAGEAHLAARSCSRCATATTVQVRNGDTLVTDGPFAETKEVLGGFYLIEADSLDEAIEWAARIPVGPQRHDRGPAGRRPLGVPAT